MLGLNASQIEILMFRWSLREAYKRQLAQGCDTRRGRVGLHAEDLLDILAGAYVLVLMRNDRYCCGTRETPIKEHSA